MQPENTMQIADSKRSLFQLAWAFLVRYRIRISLVVFIALIAEDVLEGLRPHDLLNTSDWKSVLGLGLIASGLALRTWAAGILHKTSQLTTTGPYAIVRHPLYVGSFLMMIGFCLLIDDTENIWFVLGPFAVIYVVKLLNEERILSAKFGEQWHSYAQSVSRFVPYRWPQHVHARWDLQQWLGNREYNAIAATAAGLIAIEVWSKY
jgi:protein-S-isoprenylcysteine O-methyltransferase Ste14